MAAALRGIAHHGNGMAVTRIAEELHRCASSRRAMEQLRTDQICNGKASSHCAQICRGKATRRGGTDALSSGKAVLCDGKEPHRLAMAERRKALLGGGGAKKGIGIAGICPALRGISGQRTCEGAEKRGARQVHREARALIRQATELHCCAYAKALKGVTQHRHRGAMTRRAKEMGSMDKRCVQTRREALWNRLEKLSRGIALTSRGFAEFRGDAQRMSVAWHGRDWQEKSRALPRREALRTGTEWHRPAAQQQRKPRKSIGIASRRNGEA